MTLSTGSDDMDEYYNIIMGILEDCLQSQRMNIKDSADLCTKAMIEKKQLYFFGTGHSHMLAEEVFYRAGGLIHIKSILEPSLMLHEGTTKSTKMERLEGYAEILLEEHKVEAGDVLFVISNSGLNAVPIEMAIEARKRGVSVIALTNLKHSTDAKPRHKSGAKLYELADIVIDNCGTVGDAAVFMESINMSVGPTSTVIGSFIINALVVEIVENLIANNIFPQLYLSANIEDGDEHNAKVVPC
ncbi:hypothetical protein B1748_34415 [Paenibacillus sp. MY03]|jgi:uncharacterized phosphosugar-binding protein|uniref:SIS domain-containing protein n=1 Tax=Paenibacillus sp. MY03 TaxID=302980 RepID=UPI000B3CAD0E|nr:SIS domain-containing protein [Paenibacillus sp. MY03]OUS68195.1 hypothetical protein B1748_34415 [Paenibacillus sp. MY03]